MQDGCNNFCSYCIVPYARGRSRSRRLESIINEIQEVMKQGKKEIVITGIHIASYKQMSEVGSQKSEIVLIDLLEEIDKIEGLEKFELGSLEPTLITEEFVERLKRLEKLRNHFHLSLQSGCDKILKSMNRKYTTSEFEKATKLLRDNLTDVVLTTDIIVGFPGETDEDFEETYMFLKKINFNDMHVFKFSPRKGTPAAKMQEQVDERIKEERSKRLIESSN
ncbi:MAG: MiaB/RimO family radical SAM methylthiotransferase [Oscillospiraceae bacterium]|nr:MiaB/RimO family radical SAM methylthiotransferase [Oscillospiraceae bacterium]